MKNIEKGCIRSDPTDNPEKKDPPLFLKCKDVLTEIARLIGSEDLKLHSVDLQRMGGRPFEQTCLAGIVQIEFI